MDFFLGALIAYVSLRSYDYFRTKQTGENNKVYKKAVKK